MEKTGGDPTQGGKSTGERGLLAWGTRARPGAAGLDLSCI